MSKKSVPNSHCPVPFCKTTAPHTDDIMVAELMRLFSPPEGLARWAWVAMMDLRNSIIRDIEEGRVFAWQTRVRQVEELYFKTLYCAFFATLEELPHILSGVMPNSLMPFYRKVNAEVLKGNGQLEVPQTPSRDETPAQSLHSAAHASYLAIFKAISMSHFPEKQAELQGEYITHLNTYCDRLEYMHRMFAAGRDKHIVQEAFTNMHRPANHWHAATAQAAKDANP